MNSVLDRNVFFVPEQVGMFKAANNFDILGKELFTSADNCVLTIGESVPPGSPVRKLILAAVMCIDMILKE